MPTCECHGVPKAWHNDPRRKSGGYWRCRIRKRASRKNHRDRSPKYRSRELARVRRSKRAKVIAETTAIIERMERKYPWLRQLQGGLDGG